jgi:hypothetical protein
MGLSRGGRASSLSIHLQVQLKRFSLGLCPQRWYASPSKCKHKHKARLRLTERGLTLPSSGRAYGTPLKSNVRPRFKPHTSHASRLKHHPGRPAVHCAGCACARNTDFRRRSEFCASAQARGRSPFRLSTLRRLQHGRIGSYQRRYKSSSKHPTSPIEALCFQSAS